MTKDDLVSKDTALKMAIEALEECLDDLQGWAAYASDYFQDKWDLDGEVKAYKDKIQACKEALDTKRVCENEAQPAQEPVAWLYTKRGDWGYTNDSIEASTSKVVATIGKIEPTPLYTHPAPSCQGLNNDEIINIIDIVENEHSKSAVRDIMFSRAIEQALKEKNHGI